MISTDVCRSTVSYRWWFGILSLVCLMTAFKSTNARAVLPFFGNGIAYELVMDGNETLKDKLRTDLDGQRSDNRTLQNYTDPAKIARYEQNILKRSLRSQGYYSGTVSAELQWSGSADKNGEDAATGEDAAAGEKTATGSDKPRPGATDQAGQDKAAAGEAPVVERILYRINPGPQYLLESVSFVFPDTVDTTELQELTVAGGSPFIAERILQGMDRIRQHILSNYCFFEVRLSYDAYVVPGEAKAGVTYTMNDSPLVRFGEFRLQDHQGPGQGTINHDYLKPKIPFSEGDCFRRSQVDKAKANLLRTNLIAGLDTRYDLQPDDTVDVTVTLKERAHRTVKAGVGYATDEGGIVSAGWEHRNILGAGQKLEVDGRASKLRKNIDTQFEVPAFVTPDNRLVMEASLARENLDSYDSEVFLTGLRLEHQLNDDWTVSAGTRFKYSLVNDEGDEEEFGLLSFPFQLKWDTADDILNPTTGWTMLASVAPYVDMLDTETQFLKSSLSGTFYYTLESIPLTPTLAFKAATGTISGVGTRDIPADERFYVGGGGSVRGYPYQTLSTIEDDDPVGGSSFQEVSFETRLKLGGNWGLVAFIDGGYAYDQASPDYSRDLLWGTGLGIRYYTLFAPIRADVGVPLNKREGVDDDFQLYISIGQAF